MYDLIPKNSTNDTIFGDPADSLIVFLIRFCLTPIGVFTGICCNTLAASIFMCTLLNNQSSSVYLAALAIADSCSLVPHISNWWHDFFHTLYGSALSCKLMHWLTYVGPSLSVWIVVSFTIERYIVVKHPFKRNVWCTLKRSRCIVLIITFSSMGLFGLCFPTYDTVYVPIFDGQICNAKNLVFEHIIVFLDMIFACFIPGILIVAFNIRIGLCIWKFKPGSAIDSNNKFGKCYAKRQKAYNHTKTTRMLWLISMTFIFLNFPDHIISLYQVFQLLSEKTQTFQRGKDTNILKEFFHFMRIINYATNFFLYVAFTKRFRRTLQRLFRKVKNSLWVRIQESNFGMYRIRKKQKQWTDAFHTGEIKFHNVSLTGYALKRNVKLVTNNNEISF